MKKISILFLLLINLSFGFEINFCIDNKNIIQNGIQKNGTVICIKNKSFLLYKKGYGKASTGYTIPLNQKCKYVRKIDKSMFGKNIIYTIKFY